MQVNDLDLTVRAAGLAGYTLYGNGEPDHLNNVEQARISALSIADTQSLHLCWVSLQKARPMRSYIVALLSTPHFRRTRQRVTPCRWRWMTWTLA